MIGQLKIDTFISSHIFIIVLVLIALIMMIAIIFTLKKPKKRKPARRRKARRKKKVSRSGPEKKKAAGKKEKLPTQRQIKISNDFSPKELQMLSIQLGFGQAAVARHIKRIGKGTKLGITHDDPRPLDWARLDLKQYRFLTGQVARARRGNGYIDTTCLKKRELGELWAFLKYETERAVRNIDYLNGPESPIKNPTSDYLVGKQKLEARFYNFLAEQIETMAPVEELFEYAEGVKN